MEPSSGEPPPTDAGFRRDDPSGGGVIRATRQVVSDDHVLRDAWQDNAERWIAWARAPRYDSFWRFHGDQFLTLLPAPRALTVDIGAGEGR